MIKFFAFGRSESGRAHSQRGAFGHRIAFFGTTTIDFFASGGFEKVEKSNLRQNN